MEASNHKDLGQSADSRRTCFVVSAFGSTPEEQRKHRQVLRHLISKTLEPKYVVVRADQIDDEGLITNQIIEHLIEDDLVIADLTGLNPNVFYEVAVRHSARKPIVHLMTKGQSIPFDIANMRAVHYSLEDPDILEEAQEDLKRKVESIEDSGFEAAVNPVSAAVDVLLLQGSDRPEAREIGELLASLQELRDDVRFLARRIPSASSGPVRRNTIGHDEIVSTLGRSSPISTSEVADALWIEERLAEAALESLKKENRALEVSPDHWISAD